MYDDIPKPRINYPLIAHYHGDAVRILFIASAVILVIAQSIGANLPLSTLAAIIWVTALVIAAGITNPAQIAIHWCNAILSLAGTLLFGVAAVSGYRGMEVSIFHPSFLVIEVLAILSIFALYLSTRTIRGLLQRQSD
jgi:hypothetical protein